MCVWKGVGSSGWGCSRVFLLVIIDVYLIWYMNFIIKFFLVWFDWCWVFFFFVYVVEIVDVVLFLFFFLVEILESWFFGCWLLFSRFKLLDVVNSILFFVVIVVFVYLISFDVRVYLSFDLVLFDYYLILEFENSC